MRCRAAGREERCRRKRRAVRQAGKAAQKKKKSGAQTGKSEAEEKERLCGRPRRNCMTKCRLSWYTY